MSPVLTLTKPAPAETERSIEQLLLRRQRLEARLEEGWRRIDEAREAGAAVAQWETFWMQLLADYERTCLALEIQTCPAGADAP